MVGHVVYDALLVLVIVYATKVLGGYCKDVETKKRARREKHRLRNSDYDDD